MFRIKLKEAREKSGYTQKSLSKALGLSDGVVGNWEAGSREPNLETINRLAELLNVKVSDLVDDAVNLVPQDTTKEAPTVEDTAEAIMTILSSKLGRTPTTKEMRLLDTIVDGIAEFADRDSK